MNRIENVKTILLWFGSEWILWLLWGLGLIAIALVLERTIYFGLKRGNIRTLVLALDDYLEREDWVGAFQTLAPLQATAARVARAGLCMAHRGPQAVQCAMQSAQASERKALDARLTFLSTLGNNAPFIGLFGTVLGVMLAFEKLGQTPGSGGASPDVMGAIAEALVATAVGIAVALPCVATYNLFQRKISEITDDVDTVSSLILAHLNKSDPNSAAEHSKMI